LPSNRSKNTFYPKKINTMDNAVNAVNKLFAIIPLAVGCGLLFAGLTGICGLALLLAKMPWNKSSFCNPDSCCATESK